MAKLKLAFTTADQVRDLRKKLGLNQSECVRGAWSGSASTR